MKNVAEIVLASIFGVTIAACTIAGVALCINDSIGYSKWYNSLSYEQRLEINRRKLEQRVEKCRIELECARNLLPLNAGIAAMDRHSGERYRQLLLDLEIKEVNYKNAKKELKRFNKQHPRNPYVDIPERP